MDHSTKQQGGHYHDTVLLSDRDYDEQLLYFQLYMKYDESVQILFLMSPREGSEKFIQIFIHRGSAEKENTSSTVN